jgi:hypothetical protein
MQQTHAFDIALHAYITPVFHCLCSSHAHLPLITCKPCDAKLGSRAVLQINHRALLLPDKSDLQCCKVLFKDWLPQPGLFTCAAAAVSGVPTTDDSVEEAVIADAITQLREHIVIVPNPGNNARVSQRLQTGGRKAVQVSCGKYYYERSVLPESGISIKVPALQKPACTVDRQPRDMSHV